VQSQHFRSYSTCDFRGQSGGFQARMNGVASLGMSALKVEQVAREKAHTGSAQGDTRGCERTQPGCQGAGFEKIAHAGSSLSG
jgi:hypothetical protein